jgi:uridine phosphorylase
MAEGLITHVRQHPEWRVVVQETCTAAYGSMFTHRDLEAMTGLTYKSNVYYQQIRRAAAELRREHQRVLKNVPKKGYCIAYPKEHHGLALNQVTYAGRRLKRGKDVLVATPMEYLDDEQNRKNTDLLAKIGRARSLGREIVREAMKTPARPEVPKMLK